MLVIRWCGWELIVLILLVSWFLFLIYVLRELEKEGMKKDAQYADKMKDQT